MAKRHHEMEVMQQNGTNLMLEAFQRLESFIRPPGAVALPASSSEQGGAANASGSIMDLDGEEDIGVGLPAQSAWMSLGFQYHVLGVPI